MGVILDNRRVSTLLFLISIYLLRVEDTGSRVLSGGKYRHSRKTSKQ